MGENPPKAHIPFVLHFLSGSCAGALAKTMVYPLDRLKMIYQVSASYFVFHSFQVRGGLKGKFQLRKIFLDINELIRNEGIRSLWKGNLSVLCRTFPNAGITYYCHDIYKKSLLGSSLFSNSPNLAQFLAGGFAGMTSSLILYPLDVWNTRMAVSRRKALQYKDVTMVQQNGLRSLYSGLLPSMIGIFPYGAVSFFTFETLKREAELFFMLSQSSSNDPKSSNNKSRLPHWVTMICGATAGLVSQSVTYPIDTIRKRMQARAYLVHSGEVSIGSQESHWGVIKTTKYVINKYGIRGLFVGLSLNWIKGPLSSGLSFTLREIFKGWAEEKSGMGSVIKGETAALAAVRTSQQLGGKYKKEGNSMQG